MNITDPSRHASITAERVAPRRALVVDDEALIRWSVAETLTTLGMAVEQAATAAATLDLIAAATSPFDVVVLDLRLPDMNDLSLLGRIRERWPGAVVVLMTAFGTPEIIAAAVSMGVHGVLTKPFELDALTRLLAQPGETTTP